MADLEGVLQRLGAAGEELATYNQARPRGGRVSRLGRPSAGAARSGQEGAARGLHSHRCDVHNAQRSPCKAKHEAK